MVRGDIFNCMSRWLSLSNQSSENISINVWLIDFTRLYSIIVSGLTNEALQTERYDIIGSIYKSDLCVEYFET